MFIMCDAYLVRTLRSIALELNDGFKVNGMKTGQKYKEIAHVAPEVDLEQIGDLMVEYFSRAE